MYDIPPKFIPIGDKEIAKTFLGVANTIMAELEKSMVHNDIQQDTRYYEPFPGALITCTKNFGLRKITIDIPIKVGKKLRKELECYCDCNFSVGKIIEETGTLDNNTGYGQIKLYRVIACNRHVIYKLYEDCLASDFTEYLPGQKVVLIAYNEAMMTCCTEAQLVTACKPKVSEYDIAHDNWRTTYRILPWNGIKLRKWL